MAPPPPKFVPRPEKSPLDKPDDEPEVVYGPETYINDVYRKRHGGRPHPSEANQLRAGDIVRQHLEHGPLPTPNFKFHEQEERSRSDSPELKISKQRSRSPRDAPAEESEREAWDSTRKIATRKLKMSLLGSSKSGGRRSSASYNHGKNGASASSQKGRNEAEKEPPESGKEFRRNDSTRRKAVHEDEIPESISKTVDNVFAAAELQLAGSRSPTPPPPADDPEPNTGTTKPKDVSTSSSASPETK